MSWAEREEARVAGNADPATNEAWDRFTITSELLAQLDAEAEAERIAAEERIAAMPMPDVYFLPALGVYRVGHKPPPYPADAPPLPSRKHFAQCAESDLGDQRSER